MATTTKTETVKYRDLYPNSPDVASIGDTDVEVTKYYIEYLDPSTGEHDPSTGELIESTCEVRQIAVYLDENNHPFVKLNLDGGEKFYSLLGGGAAQIPAMSDGKQSTTEEVLYLDIYNENGIQEKIYLPTTKAHNADYIEEFKRVFSAEIRNVTPPLSPFAGAEPEPLTRETANSFFLRTNLPEGDLVFNKKNEADGTIEASYLYIAHKNGTKKDYLRLMKKEGEDKLYVNLNGVVTDPTTTPPTTYADGTTFEVRRFLTGPNGATPPVEVLKAEVFDGICTRTVDLPMTKAEAEASSLFNPEPAPGAFLTPQEIATRDKYTEIDQRQLPNCGNKTADATKQPDPLTGNAFYVEKDDAGNIQQTYHFLKYVEGGVEKHFHVIEKDGKLYANFNTSDPFDPNFSETCLIESIAPGANPGDPYKVTYVTQGPNSKRFSGDLPISNTPENADTFAALQGLVGGTAPSTTREIFLEEVPGAEHGTIANKTEEVSLSSDGELSRKSSTTGTALRSDMIPGTTIPCMTQEIIMKTGVANPFTSGENQTLSTYSDKAAPLLTLSKSDSPKPIVAIERDSADPSKLILKMTKEQIDALNTPNKVIDIDTSSMAAGEYANIGEVDAVQIGQNLAQEITVKSSVSGGNLKISATSQGMIVENETTHLRGVVRETERPLCVGVSEEFIAEAVENCSKDEDDRTQCRIENDGISASPKEPLATALYVSATRQYREDCLQSRNGRTPADLAKPFVLTNNPLTMLYSLPTGQKDTNGNDIYADFRVGPEKDKNGHPVVYYYGHITNEHEEGKVGGKTVPKYHKVERAFFTELGTSLSDTASASPMLMIETRLEGDKKKAIAVRLGDHYFENGHTDNAQATAMHSFLADPTQGAVPGHTVYDSTSPSIGTRELGGSAVPIQGRDSRSMATVLDDNIAQMQRDAGGAEQPLPPVQKIDDPDLSGRVPVDKIEDPEVKAADKTKDTPRPRPPKERESIQLWKGIDEKNRKTWIALAAIATLFSVFIPFLGIIAGVLIGIVVANDTEFIKSIFIEKENVHKGLTAKGRKYDRELVKNQARIRDINAKIDRWNTEIADLEKSGKNPKQIATEKAKLEAKIAAAQAEKQTLIDRDKQLAIWITQDQDLGLRAELKSNAKWQKILANEQSRYSTIEGLTFTDRSTTPPSSTKIKGFDFRRSDADLQDYKTQLEAMKKQKGNKHVKDILQQQIEFCEMVQLYRKDVRKLSDNENARLARLKEHFDPTSRPPITEHLEKISKLIAQTGLTVADRSAAGLKTASNDISRSLTFALNPSKMKNIIDSVGISPLDVKIREANDGLSRLIGVSMGTLDEIKNNLGTVTYPAILKDLVQLKILMNETGLDRAQRQELADLLRKYPDITDKNFSIEDRLKRERDTAQAERTRLESLKTRLDAMYASMDPPPNDYYAQLMAEANKPENAQHPAIKNAIVEAARKKKFQELREKAKDGVLTSDEQELFLQVAKDLESLGPTEGGLLADDIRLMERENKKAEELFELKTLLNKKPSELSDSEKQRLAALKAKYKGFKRDSSVLETIAQDAISMGEASHMQEVAEGIVAVTGKSLANIDAMTADELEVAITALPASALNNDIKKVLVEQMEYKEYQYLREIESKQLTKKEQERLKKLKAKFGSSNSPVSSFLESSAEYSADIQEYLRKSDEYIHERETRAEQAVETDLQIESGDGKDVESAVDRGLAEYQATDESVMQGGNIQNRGDKNPGVKQTDKKDSSKYQGDGSNAEDLTDDTGMTTDERKRRQSRSTTGYNADGSRTDGLGR